VNNKGKFTLYVNKDKVSNTISHMNKSYPMPSVLNKIIADSLNYFPRKHILSTIRDGKKKMGIQNYDNNLKTIFGKVVTVDIIRSSYITKIYTDPNVSLVKKKDIAKLMRTSVSASEINYKKIIPSKQPSKQSSKQSFFDLKKYMKEYKLKNKSTIKENQQNYYKKNKDRLLKNKILRNLNVYKNTRHPSPESIKKYNLTFNKTEGLWK
jgi:hypothetical protein